MSGLSDHQRSEAVRHARFLHANAGHVAYQELRPIPAINESLTGMQRLFDRGYQWETDCSGAILWIAKWSGWKSPTGMPFDEYGSTMMWQHLTDRFTDPEKAGVGTIGVYGPQGDEHAVMITQPGRTRETTEVFSHGLSHVCSIGSLADMDYGFVGQPFTFLTVGNLG